MLFFEAYYAESLLPELCIDSCDDFGAERPELAAVVKYGSWTDVLGACFGLKHMGTELQLNNVV